MADPILPVEQRVELFRAAMEAAERQYGITVMPAITTEKLGDMVVQARVSLKLVQIKDWQPPTESEESA